jgi:hypothetical protein
MILIYNGSITAIGEDHAGIGSGIGSASNSSVGLISIHPGLSLSLVMIVQGSDQALWPAAIIPLETISIHNGTLSTSGVTGAGIGSGHSVLAIPLWGCSRSTT